MRRKKEMPGRSHNDERGIVILLVAVFMLFVMGAMAALSIDVATLYTARSEAQLSADAAALAGARVLANSGLTSSAAGPAGAEDLARTIATQVAASNQFGGRNLSAAGTCTPGAEISVCFPNDSVSTFITNPQVTVRVQRTDLPTFFARIWGRTQLTVAASATAEAYNPSNSVGIAGFSRAAVKPACVKPWLLPNMDPSDPSGGTPIFSPTGDISNPALLGWTFSGTGKPMTPACPGGDCSGGGGLPAPTPWNYYPGADASFLPPTHSLPTCTPALTQPYQESIAGCVQQPIACNDTARIDDLSPYPGDRNADTRDAVNCLTHATPTAGDADEVDTASGTPPSPPFQFLAGAQNPIAGARGKPVMVSSSLVTVPVFNVTSSTAPPPSPVQIVGFVQLFLNPDGLATPAPGNVDATIINMAGCGTGPIGQPILGQGSSPVVVRLISSAP